MAKKKDKIIHYQKEYSFKTLQERTKSFRAWERKQKAPIKYGSAGEYIGDREILGMAGKSISITRK